MEVFARHPHVMDSAPAKKIVYVYNLMSQVLLEYEILYHMAWLKSVDAVVEGISIDTQLYVHS